MSESKYTAADYKAGQPRWCPGCGDHAFLNSFHKALAEIGTAPQDIAVIGFDNSILSKKCHPSISTLSQPLKEMGDKAVGMIIGLINEEIISISSYELDSRIISRDTTTAQKLKNM